MPIQVNNHLAACIIITICIFTYDGSKELKKSYQLVIIYSII